MMNYATNYASIICQYKAYAYKFVYLHSDLPPGDVARALGIILQLKDKLSLLNSICKMNILYISPALASSNKFSAVSWHVHKFGAFSFLNVLIKKILLKQNVDC